MTAMEMMVDVACVRGELERTFGELLDHEKALGWIAEGYTIDEAASGIASNAGIVVPPAQPAEEK